MVQSHKKSKKTLRTSTQKSPNLGRSKTGKLDIRRVVVGVGVAALAVAAALTLSYLTVTMIERAAIQDRQARISEIYESFKLGEAYTTESVDIFGDKRPYEWDRSRTQSSTVIYTHGNTVTGTLADLDTKIKAAGFSFVDEPYPNTVGAVHYHYVSEDGVYVRVTVESKQRLDAYENARLTGVIDDEEKVELLKAIDPNAAPSVVTLKVNLDDNNE